MRSRNAGDAADMQVRSALMVCLQNRMRATGNTQAELAKRPGVAQPRNSASQSKCARAQYVGLRKSVACVNHESFPLQPIPGMRQLWLANA